jgi:DNA polymerase III delta prime subunit
LGLTLDQTAVVRGLDVVVQRPDESPRLLQPGTRLVDVFDDHRGQLLILGAPGAGKTTLLLELAKELLERAEQDTEHPIPVVFNLSSWALERLPLHEWMKVELNLRSDAPKKLAREWVTNEHILPLLDGLDEVASEHRAACVAAINAYRRDHGWVPIVVCSRIAEYEGLSEQLLLPGAVAIQPLKRGQIEDYLERAGPALASVRAELRAEQELWDILDTPLMLSVVALAYQDEQADSASPATPQDVFGRYLQAMFRRRAKETRYSEREIRNWLAWLARNLARRGQTVFFLEDVVPEWFLERRAAALATTTVVALSTLLGFIWMWLLMATIFRTFTESKIAMWYYPTFTAPISLLLAMLGRRAGPVEALRVKWPGIRRVVVDVVRGTVLGFLAGMVLSYGGCSALLGSLIPVDERLFSDPFFSQIFLLFGEAGGVALGLTFALKAPRVGTDGRGTC